MADKESSEKQEAQELSNSSKKQGEEDSVDPEVLKNIPPEFRQIVEVGMARLGPVPNPLLQKIPPEHVDKQLYLEIVKSIVLAGGGFGVGIGVKTYWDRDRA